MPTYTYRVIVDNQIYARDMELSTALLLTQALFEKWHSEANLAITIEREDDHLYQNHPLMSYIIEKVDDTAK